MSSGDRSRSPWLFGIVSGVVFFAFASAGEGAPPPACLGSLPRAPLEEQLICLQKLRKAGVANAEVLPVLCDFLARSDGDTDHVLIASVLDVLRAMRQRAAPVAETLSGLLSHRSRLNKERDKMIVVRLRAYVFVTLSEIGFPAAALPPLLDSLAHVDERMTAIEVAAAARAAGSLGPNGRQFVPFLLQIFAVRLSPEEFSLERYEPRFPPHEGTTVQLEVVRALARICSPQDQEALTVLRDLSEDRGRGLDPRLVKEARHAVELMRSHDTPG